jgi:hypothetical protein
MAFPMPLPAPVTTAPLPIKLICKSVSHFLEEKIPAATSFPKVNIPAREIFAKKKAA